MCNTECKSPKGVTSTFGVRCSIFCGFSVISRGGPSYALLLQTEKYPISNIQCKTPNGVTSSLDIGCWIFCGFSVPRGSVFCGFSVISRGGPGYAPLLGITPGLTKKNL